MIVNIMMRCIRKEITELLCYCKVVYNTVGSIIIQRVSRQYNVFDYSSCSLRAVVDSAEKKDGKKREKTRHSREHSGTHARTEVGRRLSSRRARRRTADKKKNASLRVIICGLQWEICRTNSQNVYTARAQCRDIIFKHSFFFSVETNILNRGARCEVIVPAIAGKSHTNADDV